MINRIFAFEDLPCRCVLKGPNSERVRAKVVQLTRTKAVLDTMFHFDVNGRVSLTLELPCGASVALEAMVLPSDGQSLFLRWCHPDEKAAKRLGAILIEEADSYQEKERAIGAAPRPIWSESDPIEEGEIVDPTVEFGVDPPAGAEAAAEDAEPPTRADLPLTPPPASLEKSSKGDEDGTREIRTNILSRTRTVKAAELARKKKQVQVLGMDSIADLIKEAVTEAIQLSGSGSIPLPDQTKLLDEAQEGFKERLQDLKLEKQEADARVATLGEQLNQAEQLLEVERERILGSEPDVSEDLKDIYKSVARLFDRAATGKKISPQLEKEVRELIGRILDEERDKFVEEARNAQRDAITLLERKVSRLSRNLEKTQKELEFTRRRAAALEASGAGGGALAAAYEPGLDDEDPQREAKLGLLRQLVQSNKEVREHIKDQGTVLAVRKVTRKTEEGVATVEQAASAS